MTIWEDGFISIEFICIIGAEFVGCEERGLSDWVTARVCVSCFTCRREWLMFWVTRVRGRPYSTVSSLCTCSLWKVTISGAVYHLITGRVSTIIAVNKQMVMMVDNFVE